MNKLILCLVLYFGYSGSTLSVETHHCAADAIEQAGKLIRHHFGEDDRIAIDEKIRILKAIKNPEKDTQEFDVLEVWGYIYKGKYRMRFIYAQFSDSCLLMGQEILEYAKL